MSDLIAKMTASVLLIEDGRCLVLEEIDDDGFKKFNLPGGHIEFGETPLDAAIREAKEETGYDVRLDGLLGVQALTWKQHNTAKYIFHGTRVGGSLKTESGTVVHWLNKTDIEAIGKDQWIRNMDQLLLLGLEGYGIDPRAVMIYNEGIQI